ncbi:M1 family aminopeptidase [Marinitoga lauensis]|uniref:M1 family aminopeptidase n=1 Tax=Marinitoga lauensis TaxID=2201189 RepID=UPI0010131263|nr:M1 family aminopeptidase [Marinitoga lauensis]
MDFSYEDYPSKKFRKYQRKNGILKVNTTEKVIKIVFKTYFLYKNTADNVAFDDIYIWRFGWYPIVINGNNDYLLPHHKVSIKVENNNNFMPIISGKKVKDIYYSEGKYISMPIIFIKKDSYNKLTLNSKDYTINIWYRKGQDQRAAVMATHVIKSLELHTKDFGKLKYSSINVIQDPYPGMYGMAADGMFLLGDGFFTTADLVLPGLLEPLTFYVVSHELAHMWFGIGVGVDFADNNFMSESLADYAAHISMYEKYGDDRLYNMYLPDILTESFSKTLVKNFSDLDQKGIFNLGYYNVENAVIDDIDEVPANFGAVIYYNKGKRALFSLEDYLGRKHLTNILREYYKKYNEKNPSEDEFVAFLSKYVNKNILHDLFFSKKNFDASIKHKEDKLIVDLDNMKIPTKVRILTEEGTKEYVTTENMEFNIKEVMSIDIDPEMHTFDVERHNNHYPFLIKSNLIDNDVSKYDAYEINFKTNFNIINNYYKNSSFLSFEKYPYYNFDLGSYYIYSDSFTMLDMGIDSNINLNPNPWVNVNLNYSKSLYSSSQDLNSRIAISIPNQLDIGSFSKVIAATTHFILNSEFIDLDNYYISPSIIYENLYNLGIYFSGSYYFINNNKSYINAYSVDTAYFFDNYLPFLNSFSIEVKYSDSPIFNPLYDKISLLNDTGIDTLLSQFNSVKEVYGINLELFNFSDNSDKRINVYNLFSIGDTDYTLNGIYKLIDYDNLFGISFDISPEIYFITDANIPINLEFGAYYLPSKDLYSITFSLSTTLDTTIRNIIK